MSLGTRIKECRRKAMLSQEKVAELVGVSRQAVTKWEADLSAPNTENLFKLAEVLGTTVDFLIVSETDNRSIAEQVYQLFKEDESRKEKELARQKKRNFQTAMLICAGYCVTYLMGKLFLWDHRNVPLLPWLIDLRANGHSYLFGWLLSSDIFRYAIIGSMLLPLAGCWRMAFTSLAGFVIGLCLGEWLGGLPILVAEGYHYGWAIWGGIFIGSWCMGFWLEKFKPEEHNFHCRKMKLWCAVAAVIVLGVTAGVLLLVPAYVRPN